MTEPVDTSCQIEIAQALVRDEPALLSSLDFGPFVRQGIGPGPSVWIGDQLGIPLLSSAHTDFLDHRMATLARSGDIVVVRTRVPEFEAYLNDRLGIHDVTFLQADAASRLPVAAQCRIVPDLFDALSAALRDRGGLTIQPYITSGHVWRLAADLGAETGVPVHVAGPGPRAMRRCNDKLWFWNVARRIVGIGSLPPTWAAFGPAAAAGHLVRLARRHRQVIVKVPDSAGAAGNVRIDADLLRGVSTSAVRDFLLADLSALGWEGRYPLLVGVWESDVSQSPSAQLWLPRPDEGPPEVLGLFEQAVEREAGAFVGARPARLPPATAARMIEEALAIGRVFQRIGYFGPCSFDAVLRTAQDGEVELHWIECNGRWTGVSIPRAAAMRRQGGEIAGGFVVLHDGLLAPGMNSIMALCTALDDLLFRAGDDEGLMILSPPPPNDRLRLNAVAVARTQGRAEEIARAARDRVTTNRASAPPRQGRSIALQRSEG